MNFFDSIRNIIKRLFGADPIMTEEELGLIEEAERKYRKEQGFNITAIFAGKLATQTVVDSTIDVTGGTQRAELIAGVMEKVWMDAKKWIATAYGTGGVLLIPYVINKQIYVDAIPQSSMVINRVNGDELRSISIVADSVVQNDKQYFRWTDYDLDDNGLMTIRQRATDATGRIVPLELIGAWAQIMEELTISGCKHLLLAYVKNPTDARKKTSYGVPVTHGCDEKMAEIIECQEDIRREYKLKKPIVGMDTTLFKTENGRRHLPVTGLFMPVNPSGLNTTGKLWDVYDPDIRNSSYYDRLTHLYEELEKQVGTSRGILTERTSAHSAVYAATATEIKAANLDTYSIVDGMRKIIEFSLNRLVYAIDVLCNVYNLAPMGDYTMAFDWSYSLIESTQESFNQLLASVSVDAVEAAELRMFTYPNETLEEARARVDEIRRHKADMSALLLQEAATIEARRPLTLEDEVDDEE